MVVVVVVVVAARGVIASRHRISIACDKKGGGGEGEGEEGKGEEGGERVRDKRGV